MSKKKVSGKTMTLKDFHGGSIPSDLPLPSAPGVTVRASDRSGIDRPSSMGTPMGRPDHWARPHTSPATRHYDDKTPFLSHTAPIGRNFDEDERKPLDGVSAPRRTVSDESTRAPPARVEVKPEYGLGGTSLGRQVAPVSQAAVGAVNSYSARLTEGVHMGMNSHTLGGSKERGVAAGGGGGGGYPNVWSMRKGVVANAVQAEQSRSDANTVSKLAHASALDKVSSGRWQSKAVHYQADAELVRSWEPESRPRANVNGNSAYNRMDAVGEEEYYDAMLANAVEAEQSARSDANPVSKLAHASALEKVSSGRWQSKAVHYQTDAELVRSSEAESRPRANVNGNSAYIRVDAVGEKEYYDAMLANAVEAEQSAPSDANTVSKLAQASALDKVSSGRWQSKAVHYQTDAELVRSSEAESRPHGNVNGNSAYIRMDAVGEKQYNDAMLARQAEWGLVIDNQMQGGRNELLDYERSGVSMYPEVRPRSVPYQSDGVQPARIVGKLVGSDANTKLAHASALEKVSSGRWQSNAVHYQTDAELVRSSEAESRPRANVNGNSAYIRVDAVGEKEYYDSMLARQAERGLVIDNQMQGGRNELLDYERSGVSKYPEVRPRSVPYQFDGVQPARNVGKLVGSELQNSVLSEPTERPKLKLLPRKKPLESSESSVTEYVQGYRQVNDSGHVETAYQAHAHANFVKPVSTGTESGKEPGQRPKLNLKPRSHPLEKLEVNTETGRNSLFGGARPRELVLKERGIDEVAINNYDVVEHSNRVEPNILKAEKLPEHSIQTPHGEKADEVPLDQRTGRKPERKEQRGDGERGHSQRRTWRAGDNRRNTRETERQPAVAPERQTSPETWRKPVEQPKSSQGDGARYGRAASAVELAQAFSRSVSDPKVYDKVSGQQRGLNTGRTQQMPFSRLVGPTPRPQINGY